MYNSNLTDRGGLVVDIEALLELLTRHNIPFGSWGEQGRAKTIKHLHRELVLGECSWGEGSTTWPLVRCVEAVRINVYFDLPTDRLRLREDRQVFRDGRENRSSLDYSMSEKMLPGETPTETAYRGLREELGIEDNISLNFLGTKIFPVQASISYPGLGTKHRAHLFETVLPVHLYQPEGYVETDPDKTSYFIWQPV